MFTWNKPQVWGWLLFHKKWTFLHLFWHVQKSLADTYNNVNFDDFCTHNTAKLCSSWVQMSHCLSFYFKNGAKYVNNKALLKHFFNVKLLCENYFHLVWFPTGRGLLFFQFATNFVFAKFNANFMDTHFFIMFKKKDCACHYDEILKLAYENSSVMSGSGSTCFSRVITSDGSHS